MSGLTAYISHDEYLKYQFGASHPFKPIREKHALALLRELGVFEEKARLYEPDPATEDELHLIHSKDYVQYVERMCETGSGYLDFGDTPATKGLFEGARRVVGGSLLGVKLVMAGEVDHAFNPGGGLHHAMAERASGFCVFNDIAVAVRSLQRNFEVERIAIVDIDGHHGDGTQAIFYHESILTISSHRIGIFPGTGYIEETGSGDGTGYSVNLPLIRETGDDAYLYAFDEVVPPLLESYDPEILIVQFGVDGHYQDPLVGLALTTRTYATVAKTIHNLAHKLCQNKLLVLGGGGYDISNTARCWAIMFTEVCGGVPESHVAQYRRLFDEPLPKESATILKHTAKTVEEIKRHVFPFHNIRR